MAGAQVRRVPVVVRENELVGMVSQADIARAGKDKNIGEVVEAISRPQRGPRVVSGESSGDSSSERDYSGPTSEKYSRNQPRDVS